MESQTIKTQTITTNTLKHSQSSFTLIELLVVIVIIGTLAGMIFVNMSGVIERAKIARSLQFSDSLRNALMMNLVSEWKFDENSGTIAKDFWGGNNGTLVNGPTWKTGGDCVSGSCLQFDGSDDYVELPTSALGNWNELTYEVWVKAPQYAGSLWPAFIGSYTTGTSYNNQFGIWQNTNHLHLEVDTNIGNYPMQGQLSIPWNTWFHAVMVYNGSKLTEYINGVAGKSISASGNLKSVTKLRIGDIGNMNFFNGFIDEVRIYNAALPTAQIQQHYAEGLKSLLANNAITEQEYAQRISDFNQILVKN